ncbi:MAG: DoxX [Ilumatobacteraceae bacterium]|nr:DoxX [Ilumatobacteraceae bacterium]
MRSVTLLLARLLLGAYMVVHGAQKLFGAFDGPGLETAGQGFAAMGLTPGKANAALAGVSELGGGVLTAAGVADPLGPFAIMGAMTVATAVHRKAGPLGAKGGFELPVTNLALAAVLAATGPGKLHLGPRLLLKHTLVVGAGAAAVTGYLLTKLVRAQEQQSAAAALVAEAAAETAEPAATPDI